MKTMGEPKRTWRAVAKANEDFIDLRTLSGYRLALWDPHGKHYHLPSDVSDEELGGALVHVLESSQFLNAEEATTLRPGVQQLYEEWVTTTMQRHRYSNRRAMFSKMRSCGIEREGSTIKISPSCHEKLEGWSGDGIRAEDHVVVDAGRSNAEIGSALRLAFARCIGRGT